MDGYVHIPNKSVRTFKLKVHTHTYAQLLSSWALGGGVLRNASFSQSFHLAGRARWLLPRRLAAALALRDCRVRPLLTTSPLRGGLVFLFLSSSLFFFPSAVPLRPPFAVRSPSLMLSPHFGAT